MSFVPPSSKPSKRRTATYFFLRGLAIVLPPLLTLLILLWLANGFNTYVVHPVYVVIAYFVGPTYSHLIWQLTALTLLLGIVGLYFLGHFVTARIGKWLVHKLELVLTQVPLVRNVYSTVKQVTDFVLSDREVEFQRVVAVEYPRAGSWTVGFVTGEGMLECAAEVGEPMLTVLIATSPVPAGGFTVMVPRSQVIDLDMTVDQAVQFIVSCGVLTPPQQRTTPELLEQEMRKRLGGVKLVGADAGARDLGTGA